MGDSACLMHGFSYVSDQSKQGNPMRFLSESVSFGRFINESEPSLSWDKWSTFPHKKYVEEAARYAQPGSVAQKKAFFEAHYKKIAAQKAAAAALLEQENAARAAAEGALENDEQGLILNSQVEIMTHDDSSIGARSGNEGSEERVSCSEGNGMERPLLKESCVGSEEITSKKKSLKSSIRRKTWKVPSTPIKPVVTPHLKKENSVSQSAKKSSFESTYKKTPSHKSLRGLINLIPIKEPDKEPAKKASSATPKNSRTPIVAAAKGPAKYSALTPRPENRRMKTATDSSELGSKTAGPKWHLLSTVYTKSLTACRNKLQSPANSTPFTLRTEERAAKRKQKLEEKFNKNEEQQLQKTLKEKAGNEFKKLSYGFCFKARPLPDFYKERETKTPVTQPKTIVLGRSNSKKQNGVVSTPTPPPPPKSLSKNSSKTKAADVSRYGTHSIQKRVTQENKSPNIQH